MTVGTGRNDITRSAATILAVVLTWWRGYRNSPPAAPSPPSGPSSRK